MFVLFWILCLTELKVFFIYYALRFSQSTPSNQIILRRGQQTVKKKTNQKLKYTNKEIK